MILYIVIAVAIVVVCVWAIATKKSYAKATCAAFVSLFGGMLIFWGVCVGSTGIGDEKLIWEKENESEIVAFDESSFRYLMMDNDNCYYLTKVENGYGVNTVDAKSVTVKYTNGTPHVETYKAVGFTEKWYWIFCFPDSRTKTTIYTTKDVAGE